MKRFASLKSFLILKIEHNNIDDGVDDGGKYSIELLYRILKSDPCHVLLLETFWSECSHYFIHTAFSHVPDIVIHLENENVFRIVILCFFLAHLRWHENSFLISIQIVSRFVVFAWIPWNEMRDSERWGGNHISSNTRLLFELRKYVASNSYHITSLSFIWLFYLWVCCTPQTQILRLIAYKVLV